MATDFERERQRRQQQRLAEISGQHHAPIIEETEPLPETTSQPTTTPHEPTKTRTQRTRASRRPAPPSTATRRSTTPASPQSAPPTRKRPPSVPTTKTDSAATASSSKQPSNPALTVSVKRLGAQIKMDIGKIADQINNSSLRGLVSQYTRLVSDYFMNDGDSSFPHALNQHHTKKTRCSTPSIGSVLLFHIGRAVLAYYAIERDEYTQTDLDMIQKLHEIAVIGFGSHRVKGSETLGFMLFAVENHDRLMEA